MERRMRTLTLAVLALASVAHVQTIEPIEGDFVRRGSAGHDDTALLSVEEISWPQLCRYSVSRARFPDEEDMTSLVFREDVYVTYRECIGPRA
jgi:hypothetical protein